jgi:hypothetical protein
MLNDNGYKKAFKGRYSSKCVEYYEWIMRRFGDIASTKVSHSERKAELERLFPIVTEVPLRVPR